ncbi:MAG TPA: aspartyl/asparaginyl beta-hydroxylase domain-containing protein [Allosphingosinicella sp.]|nr:aspartyl/asparaginyl beta-hydroxylase domain-containing protein [Allosphingosinicella sp.]
MPISDQDAQRLIREGVDALQQGRPAEARSRFESVAQSGGTSAQLFLLTATACRLEGDVSAEEKALDQLLVLEPRLPRGLIMKGDCRLKVGDERAALNFYKSALRVADGQRLPQDLATELQRAKAVVAQLEARLEMQREASLAAQGVEPAERSPRFQASLEILAGRKQIYLQEPTAYYFPELPQIQFFDPLAFEWASSIESATDVIREELNAFLDAGGSGFRPYILTDPNRPRLDANPLLDRPDWSALFLCENGVVSDEVVARFPKSWQAVQSAPLNSAPTVMFSLLRAGSRIAPHTGMHNTRLTCHLPLIVPPACGFRVGNETRGWEEGRLLIFDDTIEHEAWNDSDEDRLILIFDVWRPELSDQEKREVAALFRGPQVD